MEIESLLTIDYDVERWGVGYNSLTFQISPNSALAREVLQSVETVEESERVKYSLELCKNEQEFRRSLDVSARASAAVLSAGVSGGAKLLKETDFLATSLVLLAKVNVISRVKMLDTRQIKLEDAARTLMERDPLKFHRTYGDYYLAELCQGGELIIAFTTVASSLSEKEQISADLDVKGGVWSVETGFAREIESIAKNRNFGFKCHRAGGVDLPPSLTTEQLIQYALEFPKGVQTNTCTYQATFYAYSKALGGNIDLDNMLLEPKQNVDKLTGWVSDYKDGLKLVDYALENSDRLNLTDSEIAHLSTMRIEANDNIKAILQNWHSADPREIPSPEMLLSEKWISHPPSYYNQQFQELRIKERELEEGANVDWIINKEELQEMDKQADKVIANWSFRALAANLLPPPFDIIVVGTVFAKMGARLGEIYEVRVSWSILKSIGKAIATGIGAVVAGGYVGTGLLKYIPGVNIWVALLVQPPMIAAVAFAAGKVFKQYYHTRITEGRDLSPEQIREQAAREFGQKLSTGTHE